MGIQAAAFAPHPPIVIPGVGGADGDRVARTRDALAVASQRLRECNPELSIFITPHGPVSDRGIPVVVGDSATGNLARFGSDYAPDLQLDRQAAVSLIKSGRERGLDLCPVTADRYELDHGVLVPLFFLEQAGLQVPAVIIGVGIDDPGRMHELGRQLAVELDRLGRRAVLVCSGDLSHRLTPGAPGGYSPAGSEFDRTVTDLVRRGDGEALLTLDPDLIEAAGECGYLPLLAMQGAMPGPARILSYEGPFGVGYLVAISDGQPLPVAVARDAIAAAVAGRRPPVRSQGEELSEPRGVFVSIKQHGQLRGCMGTVRPTTDSVWDEIEAMAVSAALCDPRFPPVTEQELDELVISVDVLAPPERVDGVADLDPSVYGVLVEQGAKRGVLLPDLPGVDAADQQLTIACVKAGIKPGAAGIHIYRFRVCRYGETG